MKIKRIGRIKIKLLRLINSSFAATLPDMWERTLTVESAGKTFSVIGWKCGWVYDPDYLMNIVRSPE